MKLDSRTGRFLLGASLLAAALGGRAGAQTRDEYGNPIAPSDVESRDSGGGEIRQTVARLSDFDGDVSYARGDDPDHWQTADRNVPVTVGDRLYSGDRGRAELQVHGGSYIRLGSQTDLAVLNLTDDTKQFAVKSGVVSVRVRRLDADEVFEVDTPNAAISIEKPGDYRVDIDGDGNTRVVVREGKAEVAAGGGAVSLGDAEALQIWGTDSPQYDTVAIPPADGWDRWVVERETRIARTRSSEYVSDDIVGTDDLDQYGRWDNIPSYGHVWTPTAVAVGWAPYRAGQWIWQDPWGWTWVSVEPWGWAPYHYGRWVFWTGRWYWIPVRRTVRYVRYSPALVAFVGGGPGWSASVAVTTGGYVGWFPLAPRDPLIPWWGPHVNVRVTNVTYVNRTYVTVVNRTTFVSGGLVVNNVVRDRTVVRQVEAAPVLRGPLPFVPTRESIRVATRPGAAAVVVQPPAAVVARPVVARVAPPPAPLTFDRKVAVIRENRGAPVAPAAAAEIAVRERNRAEATTAIKPVAATPGRVTLSPRDRAASTLPTTSAPAVRPAPRVEPVAPVRGRPMATAEQPVAAAPVETPRNRGEIRVRPTPRPGSADRGPVPPKTNEETSRPSDAGRRPTPIPPRDRRSTTPGVWETPAMHAQPSREEDRRYVATPRPARPSESSADRQREEARRAQEAAEKQRAAEREREAAAKRNEAPPRERPTAGQPPRPPTPAPSRQQPSAARRPPEPTPRSSNAPERATPRTKKPEPTKTPKKDDVSKDHRS